MAEVAATRDRLLEITSGISDVQFGKNLLEKKRDAIIRSIEGDRKKFRETRSEFEELCVKISQIYAMVRLYEGSYVIELLALQRPRIVVSIEKYVLMGCKYSQFSQSIGDQDVASVAMDPAFESLYVDELLDLVDKIDQIVWKYVNLKAKIDTFEKELKKTNLKINTLEYSLLPSMVEEKKQIIEVLSERERQERFTIKKLTAKKRRKKL